MKNEVTLENAKVVPYGATKTAVTLTRAQLEAAVKEINEPELFVTGDIVESKDSNIRYIVLNDFISGLVATHFDLGKANQTLMPIDATWGASSTNTKEHNAKYFKKVGAAQ